MSNDLVKNMLRINAFVDILICIVPRQWSLSIYQQLGRGGLKNTLKDSTVHIDIIRTVAINLGIMRLASAAYSDTAPGKIMALLSNLLEATMFGSLLYEGKANNQVLPMIAIPALFSAIILAKWDQKPSQSDKSN